MTGMRPGANAQYTNGVPTRPGRCKGSGDIQLGPVAGRGDEREGIDGFGEHGDVRLAYGVVGLLPQAGQHLVQRPLDGVEAGGLSCGVEAAPGSGQGPGGPPVPAQGPVVAVDHLDRADGGVGGRGRHDVGRHLAGPGVRGRGGERGDDVELQGAGVVDEGPLPAVGCRPGQGHDLDPVVGPGEPARAEREVGGAGEVGLDEQVAAPFAYAPCQPSVSGLTSSSARGGR